MHHHSWVVYVLRCPLGDAGSIVLLPATVQVKAEAAMVLQLTIHILIQLGCSQCPLAMVLSK